MMINFLKALAPGIAGSIAFWFIDNGLLKLGGHARAAGMLIAFAAFSLLSVLIMSKRDASRRQVASGRKIGGDSRDQIRQVTIRGPGDAEVLSNNRIKGSSSTDVDRIDIG